MNLNHFVVLYKIDRYGHKRRRRRVLRENRVCFTQRSWRDEVTVCRREKAQAADGAPKERTRTCRLVSFLGV